MRNSNFLIFLGGALAGAGIALIFSSEKGREWTRRAGDFARDEVDRIRRGAIELAEREADRTGSRKVRKFVRDLVE